MQKYTSHEIKFETSSCLGWDQARSFIFFLCVLLVCLGLQVSPAKAQTTCIPPAEGVPPFYNPPHWWDNVPPQPAHATELDDPRWAGAAAITYGTGAAEQVIFRALNDGTSLYLSWRIKAPPAGAPNQNVVYVGFRQVSGGDAIIKVQLTSLATTPTPVAVAQEIFLRNPDGTAGATVIPTPTWLSSTTRAWVNNPDANSWAVQMRVPISSAGLSSGINLNPGAGTIVFPMWFEVLIGTPTTPTVADTWPRLNVEVTTQSALPFADLYPDPAGATPWLPFRLSPTADATCTDGVSLTYFNIGTTNSPSSQIRYLEVPPNPGPKPINTFFAAPTNKTASPIPANTIKARFRIANWGSNPIDWEAGVPPAELWADVPNPGGTILENRAAIAPGATADSLSDIRFDWPLTNTELIPFRDGTKPRDQCMLVELSGGGLTFINRSIYRNMDVVSASKFKRDAEINILKLPPIPGGGPKRDIYLYLEILNMPSKIDQRSQPSRTSDLLARAGSVEPGLDKTMPTYRVHVYYDTGKKITTGGVSRPILHRQASFGYYVTHSGPMIGWRYALEGAEEIAPNWYKIAIPNDGKATVTTTIEAVEPGVVTPPGFKRWGLSLHAGVSIPQGNFNTFFNPGPNAGVDLEYRINPTFSLEGIYTFHRFNGETFGSVSVGNLNLHQFSFNGKVYGSSSPVRPFFNFGGGAYRFDPGSTNGGLNVGGGFQFDVAPNVAVDAMYNFHNVFTSGSSTRFSTLQGGVRFRF